MTLPIHWANAHAASCDDLGNVYLLTSESASDWSLTSLDPARNVRWHVPAPRAWDYMASARKLFLRAWSHEGALLIWTMGDASAHVLSCRDGSVRGTITGGDANVDLAGAQSLAIDRDGSLVSVVRGQLRRHTAEGQPMPLWEGTDTRTLALAPEEKADDVFAFVGWDGATWVTTYAVEGWFWGESWDTLGPRWRRFDRRGRTLAWSERYFLLYESEVAWADREGRPLAAWIVAGAYPRVMRYAADLKSFEYWLASAVGPALKPEQFDAERLRTTREPSMLQGENLLCMAPDGAMWAFGSLGAMRCFGPDGTLTYERGRDA